jgi:hypothetical protein
MKTNWQIKKIVAIFVRILFLLIPFVFTFFLIRKSEGILSQSVKESCYPTVSNPEFSLCSGFSEKIQRASKDVIKNVSKFSGFIPILNNAFYYKISITNGLSSNLKMQVDKPEQSTIMQPDILCEYNGNQYTIIPNDIKELNTDFNPSNDTLLEIKCLTGFNYSSRKQMIVAPLANVSTVIFEGKIPEARGEFEFSYKLNAVSKIFIYSGIFLFWIGFLALLRSAILFLQKGFRYFIE